MKTDNRIYYAECPHCCTMNYILDDGGDRDSDHPISTCDHYEGLGEFFIRDDYGQYTRCVVFTESICKLSVVGKFSTINGIIGEYLRHP